MCMDIHTDKEIKIQTIMEKFTPLVRANIPCITLLPKGGHYWRQRNAAHTGRNALCQTSFSSFSGMDSGSIKRNTSRVVAWCELIAKTVATSHLAQLKINREEPIRPNKLLWRVPEDWIVSSSPSAILRSLVSRRGQLLSIRPFPCLSCPSIRLGTVHASELAVAANIMEFCSRIIF